MKSNRKAWGAWLLAPIALVVGSAAAASPAHATDSATADQQAAPHDIVSGVHRKHSGQWVRSFGDPTSPIHPLVKQLLPPEYVPGMPLHPEKTPALITTPQPDGLGPSQIAAAYNLGSLPPGTGNIVAIIDSPDYYAVNDLNGYRSGYGLPALPVCTGNGGLPVPGGTPCFAQVNEQGELFTPTAAQDDPNGGDIETALDMDMVSAVCPACSILLVQLTGDPSDEDGGAPRMDYVAAVKAASKLGAVAISISLGGPEAADPLMGGQLPADPTGYSTPGHLVFAASGDFGYDEEMLCGAEDAGCGQYLITTPSYPGSAPDIISVGGTALYNANKAGVYTESVWDDGIPNSQDATTSGCSKEFAQPTWQANYTALSSSNCKMRATADLSAAAAYAWSTAPITSIAQLQDTDIIIYSTWDPAATGINGFSGGTEGTSAASPMMAALFARIGLANTVSSSLGWPYEHASAFNDITKGTDDVDAISDASVFGIPFPAQCTGNNLILCQAGPGWDGPTGVGTPNGTLLLAAATGKAAGDAGAGDGGKSGGDGGVGETGDGGVEPAPAPGKKGCDVSGAGTNTGFGASGLLLGLAAIAARRRRVR